jgi:hypothetical protein
LYCHGYWSLLSNRKIQQFHFKLVPNAVSVVEHSSGTIPVNADLLASKISKLVLEGLKPSRHEQNTASIPASVSNSPRGEVKASNLLEFIEVYSW